MRHLTNLASLSEVGIERILDLASDLKKNRGKHPTPLTGKQVALVFEKASTRTRISLEVAVSELGGHPLVLTSQGSQMGRGEPIRDTARVLGRMVHAITLRTAGEERLREMQEFARIPVLNALTDQGHPMQLMADLLTVREHFGSLNGLVYCFLGDGNNMANSWIEAAGLLGLELQLACPVGYEPDREMLAQARARGGRILLSSDPAKAVAGAHVISTDVFTSMGQEAEEKTRQEAFSGYLLDTTLLKKAAPNARVLHCLPAHRGEEISDEVLESPASLVWDQAEARLHTAKALLLWALETPGFLDQKR